MNVIFNFINITRLILFMFHNSVSAPLVLLVVITSIYQA